MVNSRFTLVKNRVRPDSQLFNSWGCNSWGKGMECPPSQLTRESGKRRKLPQRAPGLRKTSFGVFTAYKNTPDFTSPDLSQTFSIFPDHFVEFPDFSRFSGWVVTLYIDGAGRRFDSPLPSPLIRSRPTKTSS